MKYFLTALFLCFSATVFAQQGFLFEQKNDVKIVIGSDTLMHPWVGGFNSPVFSKIDLNQDGTEDLYVFDRETNRSNTFLADSASGIWKWKPAPQYENLFPSGLGNWVLLRDYNGDGKKDLITLKYIPITGYVLVAYKNATPAAGPLTFDPPLFLQDRSASPSAKIGISTDVLPAISDLDNDGDLDILVFGGTNGNALRHFRNTSKDNFPHADSLWFLQDAQNWAGVTRCSSPTLCNSFTFQNQSLCKVAGTNHSGMANILALDLDNDQDKDLLIGEETCTNLVRLTNFGTPAAPAMNPNSLQINYPTNTTHATIENYPAAYYEDVNFDGKKDLLAAPFIKNNRSDKVDMSSTAWFYENAAVSASLAPVFSFVRDNFLQDEMIELGEAARPVFADIDADGDQDLLIGNYAAEQNRQYKSTVSLFENVGTAVKPLFKLANSDYLRFSLDNVIDLKLQFGDMNGDGSQDLIVKYVDGSAAFVDFIPNTAQPNQAFVFNKAARANIGLTIAEDDSPFFYDMDADGDLDVLLGTNSGAMLNPPGGAIQYFKRVGAYATDYASWQLENTNFGGIPQDLEQNKELQPFIRDMNNDGKPDLVTVANGGRVEVYSDVMRNLQGTFSAYSHTLFNSLKNTYEPSRFGLSLHAAYADLNGDTRLEMVVGTRAGGVVFLQNNSTVKVGIKETVFSELQLQVYPNPADKTINITAAEQVQISVFDAAGKEILTKAPDFRNEHQVNTAALKPGIYFLKLATEDLRTAGRTFIVAH